MMWKRPSARQLSLAILVVLLIGCAVFEFLPAIIYARYFVPEELFTKAGCGCQCISDARSWYGTFNPWGWLCLFVAPLLVLFMRPAAPRWEKIVTPLAAIVIFYLAVNLDVPLHFKIINAPFNDRGGTWSHCFDTGDGGSLVFALFFGWIPACIYTIFWFVIRWSALFVWKRYFCKSAA